MVIAKSVGDFGSETTEAESKVLDDALSVSVGDISEFGTADWIVRGVIFIEIFLVLSL